MRRTRLLALLLALLCLCGCASQTPAPAESAAPDAPAETEASQAPTAAPEPAPTPEPSPVPTPEPTPDLSPLPDEWFDDAVIIGDSVSATLEKQCIKTGDLGDVTFFVIISYSVRSAVNGQLKIWIDGEDYMPPEAIAKVGANKVFIMMGVNDIAQYGGVERTMECWATLVENIHREDPGTVIFIESCLPVAHIEEYSEWNNAMIDDYNEQLRQLCEDMDCVYVDLAHYFKDEDNGMELSLTWDYRCHPNYEGAALWIEQLRNVENYSVDPRSLQYGAANGQAG